MAIVLRYSTQQDRKVLDQLIDPHRNVDDEAPLTLTPEHKLEILDRYWEAFKAPSTDQVQEIRDKTVHYFQQKFPGKSSFIQDFLWSPQSLLVRDVQQANKALEAFTFWQESDRSQEEKEVEGLHKQIKEHFSSEKWAGFLKKILQRYQHIMAHLREGSTSDSCQALVEEMRKQGFLLPDEGELTLSLLNEYMDFIVEGLYAVIEGQKVHPEYPKELFQETMILSEGEKNVIRDMVALLNRLMDQSFFPPLPYDGGRRVKRSAFEKKLVQLYTLDSKKAKQLCLIYRAQLVVKEYQEAETPQAKKVAEEALIAQIQKDPRYQQELNAYLEEKKERSLQSSSTSRRFPHNQQRRKSWFHSLSKPRLVDSLEKNQLEHRRPNHKRRKSWLRSSSRPAKPSAILPKLLSRYIEDIKKELQSKNSC